MRITSLLSYMWKVRKINVYLDWFKGKILPLWLSFLLMMWTVHAFIYLFFFKLQKRRRKEPTLLYFLSLFYSLEERGEERTPVFSIRIISIIHITCLRFHHLPTAGAVQQRIHCCVCEQKLHRKNCKCPQYFGYCYNGRKRRDQ